MNAVDTNVLIYVRDDREPAKQATAYALIQSLTSAVLLWQVACEYIAASRKIVASGYNVDMAWQDIRKLQTVWVTKFPTLDVLMRAEELMRRRSLSSWDALLVAACLEAGVTRLYTEDFDDSLRAEGLEVVNPFAAP
jgi:predicted nucleic acid-binding protein